MLGVTDRVTIPFGQRVLERAKKEELPYDDAVSSFFPLLGIVLQLVGDFLSTLFERNVVVVCS